MDEQTWQNIIEGDRVAYAKLYADYFKKFYNYGRKFTIDNELIQDAIQEVFLIIWSRRKTLKIKSFNSYFFSSFRFVLFKKIKQSKKVVQARQVENEPEFSIDYAIINKEINEELQQKLQSALENLTPRQREAIFLRFYEGLSYEEVAAVLNISVKATYKIMARSLLRLKDKIALPISVILMLLKLSEAIKIYSS